MAGKAWDGSGDEFEALAIKLLRCKYGHLNLSEVPSGHGGDYGIEAFSRNGCAYQCYAAEEPIDIATLYEKQRNKITKDLKKFTKNAEALEKLFGQTKISFWVLIVPRHDSADLLIHAAQKAQEIIALGLPYVSPDFAVQINTLENFAQERALLLGAIDEEVRLELEQTSTAEVAEWNQQNDALVQTLTRKLCKVTLR